MKWSIPGLLNYFNRMEDKNMKKYISPVITEELLLKIDVMTASEDMGGGNDGSEGDAPIPAQNNSDNPVSFMDFYQ